MKQLTIILAIFFLEYHCFGQTSSSGLKLDSLSLTELSDSLIKSEVAAFTLKGATLKETDQLSRAALTEMPVHNCSDKEVYLSLSTFTSSVSTFIHFYFVGDVPDKKLDSIFVVTHSHYRVEFPKGAFQGLLQNNSCSFTANGKKENFYSPYYRAFYSQDKKRLYIYMLGGADQNKYEVTWIIINDKFYARVIDRVI